MKGEKKKLVFLSDKNRYLEHESYCRLANALYEEYELLYFESDFDSQITFDTDAKSDRLQKEGQFHKYLELEPFSPSKVKANHLFAKVAGVWGSISSMRKWRKCFINSIKEIDPAAIVMITPRSFNARLSYELGSEYKKICIQTSAKKQTEKINNSLGYKMNRWLYNALLRLPIIPEGKSIYKQYKETYFLFWSDVWVKHIEIKDQDRFRFVGNILFDELLAQKHPSPATSSPVVLVLLNKELNMGLKNWDIYADFYKSLVSRYPNFEFVFKAHPLGDFDRCQRVFEGSRVTKNKVSYNNVDLVLTHWSTVCLESISQGVPTILINPEGQFDFAEFHLDTYPAIATTVDKFDEMVNDFLGKHSSFPTYREEFLKTHLFSGDGKSTERIVQTIKSIVHE